VIDRRGNDRIDLEAVVSGDAGYERASNRSRQSEGLRPAELVSSSERLQH
jgi:hypothetical protein